MSLLFKTPPLVWGEFIERPNRFIVMARISNLKPGKKNSAKIVKAHLPNPGRLKELLLPGAIIGLLPRDDTKCKDGTDHKTAFTLVAVQSGENIVMLHTHWSNRVTEILLNNKLIPGLENAEVIKREATISHGKSKSRFDFLMRKPVSDIENQNFTFFIEVKSCTAFYNKTAMFPDAPTIRGKRHLEHLGSNKPEYGKNAVIFLIQNLNLKYFSPDYHTDPDFAQTLINYRNIVDVYPVAIGWIRTSDDSLQLMNSLKILQIPWEKIEENCGDKGAYLLLIKMSMEKEFQVGALGSMKFRKGWYIYVGSAMKNLQARINRHLRKRKKMHWHVDYLLNESDHPSAIPLRSSSRKECEISRELKNLLNKSISGFGCSDCDCDSHLFFSEINPLHIEEFHKLIARFSEPVL